MTTDRIPIESKALDSLSDSYATLFRLTPTPAMGPHDDPQTTIWGPVTGFLHRFVFKAMRLLKKNHPPHSQSSDRHDATA